MPLSIRSWRVCLFVKSLLWGPLLAIAPELPTSATVAVPKCTSRRVLMRTKRGRWGWWGWWLWWSVSVIFKSTEVQFATNFWVSAPNFLQEGCCTRTVVRIFWTLRHCLVFTSGYPFNLRTGYPENLKRSRSCPVQVEPHIVQSLIGLRGCVDIIHYLYSTKDDDLVLLAVFFCSL